VSDLLERLRLGGLDLNVPTVAQISNVVTNPKAQDNTTGVDSASTSGLLAGVFARVPCTWDAEADFCYQWGATQPADTTLRARQLRILPLGPTGHPAGPGDVWTCSAFIKSLNPSVGTRGFRWVIVWSDAAGVQIGATVVSPEIDDDTFVAGDRFSYTTPPAPANTAFLHARLDQTTVTANDVMLAEATRIQVEKAPAASPYFDGDTLGYRWSGLADNSVTVPTPKLTGKGFSWQPARKLLEWVKAADGDGSRLVRPPTHENAVLNYTVRIDDAGDMDATLDVLGELVDKLQAAERTSAGGGRGLELLYTPAGSERTGTIYVQAGEIEDLPHDHESGWFFGRPEIKIRLDCHPFIFSDEKVYPAAPTTSSLPLHELTVPDVGGDVAAEARLTFTDMAGQLREYVRWFLDDQLTTPLLIDSDQMVVTGMGGVQMNIAGAYDNPVSGNNAIRGAVASTPSAVCSTAELSHVGVLATLLRFYAHSDDVQVRLAYRVGRGQWTTLPWVSAPTSGKWCEVDLGRATVSAAAAGTQGFTARFEAKCDNVSAIDIDFAILGSVGVVGGGTARETSEIQTPAVFAARDEFNQFQGVLTGKLPSVGPAWAALAGSDATDYNVDDDAHDVRRTSTLDTGSFAAGTFAGRAVGFPLSLGSVIFASNFWVSHFVSGISFGHVVRAVNGSNFMLVSLDATGDGQRTLLSIYKVIGGALASGVGTEIPGLVPGTVNGRLTTEVIGTRVRIFYAATPTATPVLVMRHSDPVLGTTLASGGVYLWDQNLLSDASTRVSDNVAAWVPDPAAVCFPNQSIEYRGFGPDAALREDPTGTYSGQPAEYRGARFALPPGTSRIAVMARRNDINVLSSEGGADAAQLQVAYRERHLVVPR
jgi:hypothetical protein